MKRILLLLFPAGPMGCDKKETPQPAPAGPKSESTKKEETAKPEDKKEEKKDPEPAAPKMAHEKGIVRLAFSMNGEVLASLGEDYCVRVWDARTGVRKAEWRTAGLGTAQPSADGKNVMVLSTKEWALYSVAEGKEQWGFAGFRGSISRDGAWAARGVKASCDVLDSSGKSVRRLAAEKPDHLSFAWSPDGECVAAVALGDKVTVEVWEAKTGSKLLSKEVFAGAYGRLTFAADGGSILYCDTSELHLLDLKSGEAKKLSVRGDAAWFAPDGARLLVVLQSSVIGAFLYEFPSLKKIRSIEAGKEIQTAAFHPDGKTLALGLVDGAIRLQSTDEGTDVTPK